MEDDDEAALDEGMEPESPTGADPGDGDDDYDDGDDGVAAGGAVSRTIEAPRGTRPVSDKVRELGKAIAAKLKAKPGEHDLADDDDIDYDEQPNGSEVVPPQGPPPGVPAIPAATEQPQTPPAPALDPEVARLREDFTRKMADIEAREKTLAERERTSDLATLAESYFERGAPAIVEVLKKWEGVDGEELKDAVADLVSDLTASVLGVEVPQEVKDRLEAKRTRKQVKRMRADQARLEQERTEKQAAAQEAENRVRVKGILQQEISKPEHAPTYPWLLREPNAAEIIVDVVDHALKKDGTKLTWQEAAKRANDYLKTQYSAWYDARRDLLTTAPGQGDGANGKQQRSQGDQQVRRSQAPPARPQAPPPPEPMKNGKWDPDAHRRSVKAKFRNAFTRQDEE